MNTELSPCECITETHKYIILVDHLNVILYRT